ncbi:MAG: sensor domain-containing diguanylate cyclase [Halochromatium sp.]|nr:sensor domain-containing diguanylate cyclase [Halochromatium sp.]
MNLQREQDDQAYLRTLSVLYVEDEDDIREELAVFLRRRVATVHTAANGRAGLDAFSQYRPDLVITDIRMPVMTGLEMAERIRAINPATPVIITTAFEETRYFQKAIELGVDQYLTKPLNLDSLAAALLKCARLIRAETALREVEERYHLLFQLSHIAISVAETAAAIGDRPNALIADGQITDCNAALSSLLGYARQDELTALQFGDLLMPEALGRVNRLIRDELLLRGFSSECEVDLRHRDGRAVPVIVQFILRRDAAGQAIETWAVMRDLSEQRRAEHALRLAAGVFDNADEAILLSDRDNRILSVNRSFSRLTGYAQAEVIGRNPRLLQSGRHGPAFYAQLWETLLASGHWQGEIWNRRKEGEVFPEWLSITAVRDSQGQVLNFIGIFSDLSQIKAATQEIEFLAHYDPLTRLANRRLLEDRTGQLIALAARQHSQLALMFIDLDRFKVVNDSLGHATGDAILECVAHRLRTTMREVDVLARLGGDEFVCVLPEIAETREGSQALVVARRLLKVLNEPMQIAEHALTVTSSIGISLYPTDGVDYETLLKQADAAMYSAKKTGRANVMCFSPSMNLALEQERQLETALRHGLKTQEFELYYQPQVGIGSGRLIGMEALLRWTSEDLGPLTPGNFIPVAEETGLILALGEWVLREACRQTAHWQRQGLPPVVIAVNLSALQFRQSQLPEIVRCALHDNALAAQWLELELTESVIMQDAESAIASLRFLKEIGATLAIDDFGTGYSSLSYLKRFALDKLKIDLSFIQDLPQDRDDAKIVTAIISLAHALNLKVIAEGVETEAQWNFLRDHDCDEIQGYWYSQPLPAQEMEAWLRREGRTGD